MFVHIQGVQREGYPGVWSPGRFWSSAEAVRVEVLSQDEDPELEEVDVFEHGKKTGTRKVASIKKIGRKTFEQLKKDPRIRILADGETDDVATAAALKKAREASATAEERAAVLEQENAELKNRLEAVSGELAALQAMFAQATEPGKADAKGSKGK